MEYTQQDFEKISLLEMLDFATRELQPNINKPKRHYKYLFTMHGRPIDSLRQISDDTKAVIVSDNPKFKGVYSSDKVMSYDQI